MRIERTGRINAAIISLASLAMGCVSSTTVHSVGDKIKSDIEQARRAGAYRCAPGELALAETNLDFAFGESDKGDSAAAQRHLSIAQERVSKALEISRGCNPKQVIRQETEPKVVVRIAPSDRDQDGAIDAEDQCPDVPGPKENHGCPLDSDADGIRDDVDRCPSEAEDKDGFQDEDGCPDLDNDRDGVTDNLDACPNDPGPVDNDGCPRQFAMIEVKKDHIELKQQIKFQPAKAVLTGKASLQILDEVAQVLRDYPRIRKVRIEGYTDSLGKAATNKKLSQMRAEAVMAYLKRKGVEASRLEAVGYGMTKPIASNSSETGRALNRRTEFNIIDRD